MKPLTLLIPTRNRPKELRQCLQSMAVAIGRASCASDVDVLVADNGAGDAAEKIVADLRTSLPVRYEKQVKERATAEESFFYALTFVNTEYVWSVGDDDRITPESIGKVVSFLQGSSPDLMLLNMIALIRGRQVPYFQAPYPALRYEKAADLFGDFGFASATTTLSCLCFRPEVLIRSEWKRFLDISAIYSHSVALCGAFFDRLALVVPEPFVLYRQNTISEEGQRIFSFARKRHGLAHYPLTAGLARLLKELSRQTGSSVSALANSRELHLNKLTWRTWRDTTSQFIAHTVLAHLEHGLSGTETVMGHADLSEITTFLESSLSSHLFEVFESAVETLANTSVTAAVKRLAVAEALKILEETAFAETACEKRIDSRAAAIFGAGGQLYWMRAALPADQSGKVLKIKPAPTRLTIMIPTYDRARALARQLQRLWKLQVGGMNEVEILIADNRSSDRTCKVVKAATRRFRNLTYLRFETHVQSAEENINRAVRGASGEYVWLLGDDDKVNHSSFYFLLNLLLYLKPECVVFNNAVLPSRVAETQGSARTHKNSARTKQLIPEVAILRSDDCYATRRYVDLVRQYGITTGMAFISRYIFRRDIFKDFSIYLDTSPIYAHVFGFAEMFAQRDIFFVNLSLVARNESIVYARFKTLARSRAKPFYFPWTTGLVRLQMVAADRGILPADFLLGVNEVLGGKSFPLINEMAAQFIRQCKAFLESAEDAELPAFDEADEFLRYMTKGKGAVASSIEAVRRIHFELQGIRNFLVASGPETEFAEEIRRHYVPQLDGLLAVLIHDALGKGSEAHINLTSLWWAMVNWIYRRPKIRAILRQAITASPLRPPSFLMDLHIRARTAKDLITKDGE